MRPAYDQSKPPLTHLPVNRYSYQIDIDSTIIHLRIEMRIKKMDWQKHWPLRLKNQGLGWSDQLIFSQPIIHNVHPLTSPNPDIRNLHMSLIQTGEYFSKSKPGFLLALPSHQNPNPKWDALNQKKLVDLIPLIPCRSSSNKTYPIPIPITAEFNKNSILSSKSTETCTWIQQKDNFEIWASKLPMWSELKNWRRSRRQAGVDRERNTSNLRSCEDRKRRAIDRERDLHWRRDGSRKCQKWN